MKFINSNRIAAGLMAFATLLAFPAITYAGASCDIAGGVSAGASCAQGSAPGGTLPGRIAAVTNTLLIIIGAAAVIMIVIGGLKYVLSQGDENGLRSAKDTIIYAVVGLVVALLAFVIVNFVLSFF
ncbi:hypothetical protein HYX70_03880 [Candidatus Saccharibacteria bacterium]|nr:hypothetical protein [Candidatus Saccharibacteria bacterium]